MKTNRKHFSKHLAPFYMKKNDYDSSTQWCTVYGQTVTQATLDLHVKSTMKNWWSFFLQNSSSPSCFFYASNFVHLRCWNTCLTYKVYSDVISVHMLSLLSFLRILIYIHHLTSFQPLHSDKNNTLKGQINQKLDLSLLFLSHFKVTKC